MYGEDLLTAVAGAPATTWLRYDDGRQVVLDLPRWTQSADAADAAPARPLRRPRPRPRLRAGPADPRAGRPRPGLPRRRRRPGRGRPRPHRRHAGAARVRLRRGPRRHPLGDRPARRRQHRHRRRPRRPAGPLPAAARARRARPRRARPAGAAPPGNVQVRVESSSGRTSSWFPWAHVGRRRRGRRRPPGRAWSPAGLARLRPLVRRAARPGAARDARAPSRPTASTGGPASRSRTAHRPGLWRGAGAGPAARPAVPRRRLAQPAARPLADRRAWPASCCTACPCCWSRAC